MQTRKWIAKVPGGPQVSINSGTKRRQGRNTPTVIVIEHHILARTTIVKLLEQELVGWNFIDMSSVESLDRAFGMDVRLIALDLAGRSITSDSLLDDLAAITDGFPDAPVALLSSHDDALVESQALEMGIRGFFTTSLPLEIALAGLRLVLAGGVFCPHPLGGLLARNTMERGRPLDDMKPISDIRPVGDMRPLGDIRPITSAREAYISLADFTPREADVLAELQSGSSNKVIAGRLNLSGHTVKMHLQHIMRKMQVQNRTEVVARLGHKPPPINGHGHNIAGH